MKNNTAKTYDFCFNVSTNVINLAKSEFGVSEIKFLGYTVTAEGIKPLAERVDTIVKVPLPATVKDLLAMYAAVKKIRYSSSLTINLS